MATGNDLLKLAKQHIGEKYVYGSSGQLKLKILKKGYVKARLQEEFGKPGF